jgi:hypothetical protein
MTIKTISRRNWPARDDAQPYTTWYEPYDDQQRITAAVSWVLAHHEVTGLATAGDVTLLAMILQAERDRIPPDVAEQRLSSDDAYSSPFLSMPWAK